MTKAVMLSALFAATAFADPPKQDPFPKLAGAVLARHPRVGDDYSRCRRDLERVRDIEPATQPSDIAILAGIALTHCSMTCEDRVLDGCKLLHALVATRYLDETCRRSLRTCVDICVYPPDKATGDAVCAAYKRAKAARPR